MIKPDRFIISICGGAGSGKSSTAKCLAEGLGNDLAVRIPTDYFLKPRLNESLKSYFSKPFSYDWDLLNKVINVSLDKKVHTPDFDFFTFTRKGSMGKEFFARKIVILDSMLPHPFSKFIVKLEVSDDIRKDRIRQRDEVWKSKAIGRWKTHQLTKLVLDRFDKIDLLLDGSNDLKNNVLSIISSLKEKFPLFRNLTAPLPFYLAEARQPADEGGPIHHRGGEFHIAFKPRGSCNRF